MWKFLVVLLSVLACSRAFQLEYEDELLTSYKRARARLTPEQEEFLTELLAADDALIAEATSRGIVDDILQALAGVGTGNIRVNIVGDGLSQNALNPSFTLISTPGQQQQPQYQQQVQQQPAYASPSMLEKALLNATNAIGSGSAPPPATATSPSFLQAPPTGAPIPGFPTEKQAPQGQPGQQQVQNQTTLGGNNNHLFSTITSVIRNSNTRNVTGIVDQSLRIATPAPIREFVTGILNVVYCNSIRRLLGRC